MGSSLLGQRQHQARLAWGGGGGAFGHSRVGAQESQGGSWGDLGARRAAPQPPGAGAGSFLKDTLQNYIVIEFNNLPPSRKA